MAEAMGAFLRLDFGAGINSGPINPITSFLA
jgi:hypothetical protein